MPAENDNAPITYRVERAYEGCYYVIASDDGSRVASIGRWMPGPMVHVSSSTITSPALARAIARAMTRVANEIDRNAAR